MFAHRQIAIRRALLCFMLLIVCGCNASVQSANTVSSKSNECPEKPEKPLARDKVKFVSLGNQTVKESGMVSYGKYLGYSFSAEAGQKLSYRTTQNICTWIYTPDIQLLNSTDLTQNGNYIMQISALTGSTSFEIEMTLEEPAQLSKNTAFQPASTDSPAPQSSQHFSMSDFPKASCGDPLSSDLNNYPLTFYPVFVPYSEANLAKARSLFCQDSLKVRRKDNQELAVQVSSFTNEAKSRIFADFLSSEISGADVGNPTIIQQKY